MNALRLAAAVGLALVSTSAIAQAANNMTFKPSDIEGTWVSEGGHATFEANLCAGEELCASLVSLSEDTEAPMLEPLVGQVVISGADPAGNGQWVWTPLFGLETAKVEIVMTSENTAEARGCVADDCRTLRFEKAE